MHDEEESDGDVKDKEMADLKTKNSNLVEQLLRAQVSERNQRRDRVPYTF